MERISVIAVVTLVALRLACGWHFFNEGVKKLDPDFSSAGFLRGAKGPFAPMFHSLVKGPHGAYEILGEPIEYGSRDAEAQAELDGWLADYGKRAAAAAKNGDPLPTDIVPSAPAAEWVDHVAESWGDGLQRLGRLGASDDQMAAIEELRDQQLGVLVNYLHGESGAIEELQHEAWRLEGLKADADGRAPAPFQRNLIADKEREIWSTMQPWVKSAEQIETDFADGAVALLADGGPNETRVRSALAERSLLGWTDVMVTCVVLGAGVCVFFGVATRVAAVLAAGFLLSLIATQPPWVAGADVSAFFAWLIEMIAFLVIAAVGAGRWAGVDGLIHQMRLRVGDLSPKYDALRKPATA